MKKLLLAVLCLSMLSPAYGASEDVYVRQDVFDAKMEALFSRLHGEIEALGNKIDGNFLALSTRIDGLDKRIDDLRNNIYLWTVIIGLIVLFPFFKKWYDEREERKKTAQPTITLDDVKRLIAEAKLSTPQV